MVEISKFLEIVPVLYYVDGLLTLRRSLPTPGWRPSSRPCQLHTARARRIALDHGIRYVYVGNVHDFDSSSTYCHQCGGVLIGRDWYQLSTWNLTDSGACKSCGAQCAGLIDGPPGTWGPKRKPLRLRAKA